MHENTVNDCLTDENPGDVLTTPKPDGPLVSVGRAGELLGGICEREVYRMLKRNLFDSVNIGRRRMVVTASVVAYAEQLIAETPDPSPVPPPQPAEPGPRPPNRPGTPKPPKNA